MKISFTAVQESVPDVWTAPPPGARAPWMWALLEAPNDLEELPMQTVTTIGLDIAKSVFQVHGVDTEGNVVIRRQLKRRYVMTFVKSSPPCLVGIEPPPRRIIWSRELQAIGHSVRLMPPAEREAVCEAA